MSSSLYYRVTKVNDTSIGYLDYIIADKLFDGNKHGQRSAIIKSDFIPFLEGVKAGSSDKNIKKDCDKLISAIKKDGELELYFAS